MPRVHSPQPVRIKAGGNPEKKGHSPVITGADDEGDAARSSRKARLFIYWFPDFPVVPDKVGDNWETEDDGGRGLPRQSRGQLGNRG